MTQLANLLNQICTSTLETFFLYLGNRATRSTRIYYELGSCPNDRRVRTSSSHMRLGSQPAIWADFICLNRTFGEEATELELKRPVDSVEAALSIQAI